MATKNLNLAEALRLFDSAIDPTAKRSLARGATPASLAKLAKTVGALTPELEAWFTWHDGQKSGAFGPSENDRLLSTKETASSWSFLEEEASKWKSSWLPIATNGAGDYLVVDRKSGALVRYFHDDDDRPKRAPSLARWVTEIAEGWKTVTARSKPSAAPAGWAAVESPKMKDLKKRPAGTAFYFRATSNLGKGIFLHLFWKQAPDTWFQAANTTLERAWTAISNNLVPFQATPDRGMEFCLAKEKVFVDGKGAAHAGLFEQHFATPPFLKKR